MKKYSTIIIALVSLLAAASCTKESLYLKNPNNCLYTTFTGQFQTIWGGINSCYAFWDVDSTDWDGVYEKYLPVFEEFDRQDTVKDEQFENVYTEMFSNLVDGHLTLQVRNIGPGGKTFTINPSSRRVGSRKEFHGNLTVINNNVNVATILEKMQSDGRLDSVKNSYLQSDMSSSFAHSSLITKTSDSTATKILLLRLDNFDILERSQAPAEDDGSTPMDAIENYLKLLADNTLKGIIIDVRSNGGGTIDDLQYIFGPMLEERYTFAELHRKIGIGRYDFSAWAPYSVEPMSKKRPECRYDRSGIPIVALIDMHSVSCAEISAMLIRSLPNGYVMGETSYGGQGLLDIDFETGFTGKFGRQGDKHFCYMASYSVRDLKGECHEGKGIVPDKEVRFNITDWMNIKDTQLEAAIDFIAGK